MGSEEFLRCYHVFMFYVIPSNECASTVVMEKCYYFNSRVRKINAPSNRQKRNMIH